MSNADMRERAARGAALLDIARPYWYEGVSVGALNLLNGDTCVLGQIYGDWETGLAQLFPTSVMYKTMYEDAPSQDSTSDYYGFSAFDIRQFTDDDLSRTWRDLTQAWRDLISERRCRVLSLELFIDANERDGVNV